MFRERLDGDNRVHAVGGPTLLLLDLRLGDSSLHARATVRVPRSHIPPAPMQNRPTTIGRPICNPQSSKLNCLGQATNAIDEAGEYAIAQKWSIAVCRVR